MGAHTSSLRNTIGAAFDAACDKTQTNSKSPPTIGLEKLISLPLPSTSFSVDRSHLGVLFVLDRYVECCSTRHQQSSNHDRIPRDHDGRFSKQDLFDFVDVAAAIAHQHPPYEVRTQLQGYCTGKLWSYIAGSGGRQRFTDWYGGSGGGCTHTKRCCGTRSQHHRLTALVREACDAEPPRTFKRQGKEPFVGIASVQALHTVFDVQVCVDT